MPVTPTGSGHPTVEVLVVDDDAGLRQFLAVALPQAGYAVNTAADGREALAVLAQHRPDILLLDLVMPEMTGWDVQERLHTQGCDVPVILMTSDRGVRARATAYHAAGFLPKPFELDTLVGLLEQLAPSLE